MIANIGWATYLVFGVMNLMFIPFIYFFYPETAGRSLEEIDVLFGKAYTENKSIVKVAKETPHMSPLAVEAATQALEAMEDRPIAVSTGVDVGNKV
jgi:hypothetical protein